MLSIPWKVLASVILERIEDAVDKQLRHKQAGFRKGRSCCEQIFTQRQIMEKVIAGDGGMAINFIDFRKAFDSVHRPAVWQIMKEYGIPEGIIDIVKCLYDNSRCSVRTEGELGEWFQIVTGVRQGPNLLVIDWVMKKATCDTA